MGRKQKLKQERRIEEVNQMIEYRKKRNKAIKALLFAGLIIWAGYQVFVAMNSKESKEIIPEKNPVAVIETDKGNVKLELFKNDAPKTVENFIKLADEGFYNGTKFHRVISDFMIQGGDPLSKDDDPANDGTGGPGYEFKDEINYHKVIVGSLAMANSGPNTNGSQFFIVTQKAQPHLDGKHTVFGEVLEGMDVVRSIQQGDVMNRVYIER